MEGECLGPCSSVRTFLHGPHWVMPGSCQVTDLWSLVGDSLLPSGGLIHWGSTPTISLPLRNSSPAQRSEGMGLWGESRDLADD